MVLWMWSNLRIQRSRHNPARTVIFLFFTSCFHPEWLAMEYHSLVGQAVDANHKMNTSMYRAECVPIYLYWNERSEQQPR